MDWDNYSDVDQSEYLVGEEATELSDHEQSDLSDVEKADMGNGGHEDDEVDSGGRSDMKGELLEGRLEVDKLKLVQIPPPAITPS
jgi:hypothetical protein